MRNKNKLCTLVVVTLVFILLCMLYAGDDPKEPTPIPTPTPVPTASPTSTPEPSCAGLQVIANECSAVAGMGGYDAGIGGYSIYAEVFIEGSCKSASDYWFIDNPRPYYVPWGWDDKDVDCFVRSYCAITLNPIAIWKNGAGTIIHSEVFSDLTFQEPIFREDGMVYWEWISGDPGSWNTLRHVFKDGNGNLDTNFTKIGTKNFSFHSTPLREGWKLTGGHNVYYGCQRDPSFQSGCNAPWNEAQYVKKAGRTVLTVPNESPSSHYASKLFSETSPDTLNINWRYAPDPPSDEDVEMIRREIIINNIEAIFIEPEYPHEEDFPLDPPLLVGATMNPSDLPWLTENVPNRTKEHIAKLVISDPLQPSYKRIFRSVLPSFSLEMYEGALNNNAGTLLAEWDGILYGANGTDPNQTSTLENIHYKLDLEIVVVDYMIVGWPGYFPNDYENILNMENNIEIRRYCERCILTCEEGPLDFPDGNVSESLSGISASGRGLNGGFDFSYSSQASNELYELGNGWDHTYNMFLKIIGSNIVVHYGDHHDVTYKLVETDTWGAIAQFEKITLDNGKYILEHGGEYWTFGRDSLSGDEQRIYIESIEDTNGNIINFSYEEDPVTSGKFRLSGFTDTLGREYDIHYNPSSGLIEQVEDFDSRKISFTYYGPGEVDGNEYDLKTITMPSPSGTGNNHTTTYTYYNNASHPRLKSKMLSRYSDSSQEPMFTNIYGADSGDVSYGRVIRHQTDGGITDIHYSHIQPSDTNGFAVIKTIINDNEGNVRETLFNQYKFPTQERKYTTRATANQPTTPSSNRPPAPSDPNDPEYLESSVLYNGDLLPLRITYPDNSAREYVYQSDLPDQSQTTYLNRANLLETWVALPGSAKTLENSYEYGEFSCSCSADKVTKEADALGNVHEYEYDIFGNRILHKSPVVSLKSNLNQSVVESSTMQQAVETWAYNYFGQMTQHIDAMGNKTEYLYFSEKDPDGDGVINFSGGDATTGGYLKEIRRYTDQTNYITTSYKYDIYGNIISETDGRGTSTHNEYDNLGRLTRVIRAAEVGDAALTAFEYEERSFYDARGNVILRQTEDRGNTTGVDGNLSSTDLNRVGLLSSASTLDPAGGTAWRDTLTVYNEDDQPLEVIEEIANDGNGNVMVSRTKYRYDALGRQVLTIHPDGRADASFFNALGQLEKTVNNIQTPPPHAIMLDGDPTSFSPAGKINAASQITTYEYDIMGRMVIIMDESDPQNPITVSEFAYDAKGRKSHEFDAMGNKKSYTYDLLDRVTRIVSEGEYPIDIEGNSGNQPLSITEYVYDAAGRQVATHQILFNQSGVFPAPTLGVITDMASLCDAAEPADPDSISYYLADAPSNTSAVPGLNNVNVIGRVTSITEYDKLGRVTFIISPNLSVHRNYYDALGRIAKTEDSALNNGFDSSNIKFIPDSLSGNTMEYAYDENGNTIEQLRTQVCPVEAFSAEEFRTTYFYDALNRVVLNVDNLGNALDTRYDSHDRIVASSDARGSGEREISRRGLGSTSDLEINGFGNVSRKYYDGMGHLLRQESFLTHTGKGNGTWIGASEYGVKTDPPAGYVDTNQAGDGIVTEDFAYDVAGFLLARRDDNANVTAYIYDELGRQKVERKGLGITGSVFSISGGQSGSFYGSLPGGTAVVDTEQNGTDVTYIYSFHGQILSKTDEAGNIFTFTTDLLGRNLEISITPAAGFVGTSFQQFWYDGLGRVTFMRDDWMVNNTYEYDSLSRNLCEVQQLSCDPLDADKTIRYHYSADDSGSVSRPSSIIYPEGKHVNNTYDMSGRLASRRINGAGADLGNYQWIGSGRRGILHYQDLGARLTFIGQVGAQNVAVGYDGQGRNIYHRWEMSDNSILGNGTLVMGFETRTAGGDSLYDQGGNKLITYKTHQPSRSERYRYDSLGRLSGRAAGVPAEAAFQRGTFSDAYRNNMDPSQGGVLDFYQEWLLDGLGNWSGFFNNSLTPGIRTHSDFNEIVNNAGTTMLYDKNGNLTDDGTYTYEWDALNRLVSVTLKGAGEPLATFLYDALNRRVFQSGEFADGNGPSRRYMYDDWQMLCEYCEDNHAPHGGEMLLSEYVYGEYMDEVWLRDRRVWNGTAYETERLYFLHDPLYSVSGVMDAAGNLTEAYEYDPYGKRTVIIDGPDADTKVNFTADDIRQTASPRNIRAAYTGQRRDDITGLYYYKNRYYSADLGRFISRDPIGYADGLSLYQYAGSSPFSAVDTFGLWGSSLHKDLTIILAREKGYSSESAQRIGEEDNNVDGFWSGTGPGPIIGNQDYHFNGKNGSSVDTREILHKQHMEKAKDWCKKDKGKKSAKELGIALHPKQDISAHGDYGIWTHNWLTIHHNALSPQTIYGPPEEYPDYQYLDVRNTDPIDEGMPKKKYLILARGPLSNSEYAYFEPGGKRVKKATKDTYDTLDEFKGYAKMYGKGCCKKYYGF